MTDDDDLCPTCPNCGHASCEHLTTCEYLSPSGLSCSCLWGRGRATEAALALERGDGRRGRMTTTAYLLTRYRTSPGLTGDPCTHLGVWERLEDAQAYSDRHGGCGAWQTTTHDSVEYWARDTKDSEITHLIEALAYTSALVGEDA